MSSDWDSWYMNLAHVVASKSKDPSTKVGAILVRPDNTIASVGYNGFPRGFDDDPSLLNDRATKLSLTIHAEMNAVLSAREPVKGYKIYTTLLTCDRCFVHLHQAGIRHIVHPTPTPEQEQRWGTSFDVVRKLASKHGVFLQTHG
jgi:dCMP deaminase